MPYFCKLRGGTVAEGVQKEEIVPLRERGGEKHEPRNFVSVGRGKKMTGPLLLPGEGK